LFSSAFALALSVVDLTRLMAFRMRDFHWALRAVRTFAWRALFSADLC